MSALPDHRRDAEFGSRHSLPAESSAYRGGSLERSEHRKSQAPRAGGRSTSPIHEHSSKGSNKNKTVKPTVAESYSSDSSDSDD